MRTLPHPPAYCNLGQEASCKDVSHVNCASTHLEERGFPRPVQHYPAENQEHSRRQAHLQAEGTVAAQLALAPVTECASVPGRKTGPCRRVKGDLINKVIAWSLPRFTDNDLEKLYASPYLSGMPSPAAARATVNSAGL